MFLSSSSVYFIEWSSLKHIKRMCIVCMDILYYAVIQDAQTRESILFVNFWFVEQMFNNRINLFVCITDMHSQCSCYCIATGLFVYYMFITYIFMYTK